jgi:hypothetical protein
MSYLFKQKTKTKYDDVKSYTIGIQSEHGVDTFTCEYREHLEAYLKGVFDNDGGDTSRLVYIKEYR